MEDAEQHAFGDHPDSSTRAGLVVETHLVADLSADFTPAFMGDSSRGGTGSDAPRFQHDDLPIARQAGVEQRRGYPSGLARTCRSLEDDRAGLGRGEHLREDVVDGEALQHGGLPNPVVAIFRPSAQ